MWAGEEQVQLRAREGYGGLNADGSPRRRGHRHDLVLYNQGGGSNLMDGAESLVVSLSHFI